MKFLKQNVIFIIFVLLLVGINFPYVLKFSFHLSNNSNDWANYSTYFSGLLNPLISLFGLYLIIREYGKSIKIRNEDNVINIIENIDEDLNIILNYEVFYHIIPNTENEKMTLIAFLRFSKKTEFLEIKIFRGGVDVKTKLTFEIVQIISALYLLYTNVSKLPDEYIEYYNNKYFYILNYLFYEEFYATSIINSDDAITQDENVQKALKYLNNIWNIGKRRT